MNTDITKNFPREGGKVNYNYTFNNCVPAEGTIVSGKTNNSWVHIVSTKTDDSKGTLTVSADTIQPDNKTGRESNVIVTIKKGNEELIDCSPIAITQDGSGCGCDESLKVFPVATFKNTDSGEYVVGTYSFDAFCVQKIKGYSFDGGPYGEWVTSLNIDGANIKGEIQENEDRQGKTGTIYLSGETKNGVASNNICVKSIEVKQEGQPCTCEGLTASIKQIKHFIPSDAQTNLLIGKGTINECGEVNFKLSCDGSSIRTAYTEDNGDSVNGNREYEIYVTMPQKDPGDDKLCAFDIEVDSLDVKDCDMSGFYIKQTDDYCSCDDFNFRVNPNLSDYSSSGVTYDAETNTFNIHAPWYGYTYNSTWQLIPLIFYDNSDKCTVDVEWEDEGKWYNIYSYANNRKISIGVENNESSEGRGPNAFNAEIIVLSKDKDENICTNYNFNIKQDGYGNCCDHTFVWDDEIPSEISGQEQQSYIANFSSGVEEDNGFFPFKCLKFLKIKIYSQIQNGSVCDEKNELIAEYHITSDPIEKNGYYYYEFNLKSGENKWIYPKNVIISKNGGFYRYVEFYVEENGQEERTVIIEATIEYQEEEESQVIACSTSCMRATQSAYVAETCTCDNVTFSVPGYSRILPPCSKSIGYYSVSYDNSENEICKEKINENSLTIEVQSGTSTSTTYRPSEWGDVTKDDHDKWFVWTWDSENNEVKYTADTYYESISENDVRRDIKITFKLKIDGVETPCVEEKTITQNKYNCINSMSCANTTDVGWDSESLTFATSTSNCPQISAVTLSYGPEEENWITQINGGEDNKVTARFEKNTSEYTRYAEFGLFIIDEDGNILCGTDNEGKYIKTCTITQYAKQCPCYESYVIPFESDLIKESGQYWVVPFTDTVGEEGLIGYFPVLDDLCDNQYYCINNHGYLDEITYSLVYVSDSRIELRYRLNQQLGGTTSTDFQIMLKQSSSSEGIINHIKDYVSTDESCGKADIYIRFKKNS